MAVLREVEDALVEREPAELAVEVPVVRERLLGRLEHAYDGHGKRLVAGVHEGAGRDWGDGVGHGVHRDTTPGRLPPRAPDLRGRPGRRMLVVEDELDLLRALEKTFHFLRKRPSR